MPARGDSAEVDNCAGITKETGLVCHRPCRERAGTPAPSTLSETEGDELDARGQGDRPRLEMPEGRSDAFRIRGGRDLLQQRVRFLKTEDNLLPAGGRAVLRVGLRRCEASWSKFC